MWRRWGYRRGRSETAAIAPVPGACPLGADIKVGATNRRRAVRGSVKIKGMVGAVPKAWVLGVGAWGWD